jgi:hypothetical protein
VFTSPKPSGGFVTVAVVPGEDGANASIRFECYDDLGKLLYHATPGGIENDINAPNGLKNSVKP